MLYNQNWIKSGIYGRDHYFIQQDSVFWRAWLWQQCGGIDTSFKKAGDYYLWINLAELTSLVSVTSWVSCFRRVEGQISQDIAAYMREVRSISSGNDKLSTKVRFFSRLERKKRLPTFIKRTLYRLLFGLDDYSLVLINENGQFNRITGQYYDVMRFLW